MLTVASSSIASSSVTACLGAAVANSIKNFWPPFSVRTDFLRSLDAEGQHPRAREEEEAGLLLLRWANQYGGVVVFRALLNTPVLLVTDPAALRRIYGTHAHLHSKSDLIKDGESLLSSVGAAYKRQRALLNPSFRVKEHANDAGLLAASWRRKIEAA
ncbi:hypothetical protein DFJ73DRAFT_778058 [Zopfochytrium polystomum]|nr:hypothetical protein DFJ73DRAFT_778058 [Zopfochytrium polystomum]